MESFDLVVIGAGPGGYVCAIKATQLGLKVACIDKRATLGGTCLNVGCIPSKALLNSSYKYYCAKTNFRDYGVECSEIFLNMKQMQTQKSRVVQELTQGISYLFKKNGVTFFQGNAVFSSPTQVDVLSEKGKETVSAKSIVIATGSENSQIPGVEIDEKRVLSSTGALSLDKVPKSMIVVGGGYIGLELGSVWSRLGAAVTVVELADQIVPSMDGDVAKMMQQSLEKQGMKFKLGTKVSEVETSGKGVKTFLTPISTGKTEQLQAETLLISIGRRPQTEGLGLKEIGVRLNERGQIPVSELFETNVSGIYAIGDVVPGPMLAHKAEEEGVSIAEHLAGKPVVIDHSIIPAVVYTHPEIATVGKSEKELKEEDIPYQVGKFSFRANSRAKAVGDDSGFVKVLSHKETDAVLGVHIIGAVAGHMISEAAAVMTYGGSAEDIGRICHPHPTESEAMKEAGLMASGIGAIHV